MIIHNKKLFVNFIILLILVTTFFFQFKKYHDIEIKWITKIKVKYTSNYNNNNNNNNNNTTIIISRNDKKKVILILLLIILILILIQLLIYKEINIFGVLFILSILSS